MDSGQSKLKTVNQYKLYIVHFYEFIILYIGLYSFGTYITIIQ